MKKNITWIIIAVVAVALFLWKFVIKTSKITLPDGSTAYKMGGNYFYNTGGSAIKVDQTEYNRLVTVSNGTAVCNNPNAGAPTTQSVTPCDYFGFKGLRDECGVCLPIIPAVVNCAQTAGKCGLNGTLYLSDTTGNKCHYTCYEQQANAQSGQ